MLITRYGINIGGNKIRRDGLLKKKATTIVHFMHEKRFKQAKTYRPIKVLPDYFTGKLSK